MSSVESYQTTPSSTEVTKQVERALITSKDIISVSKKVENDSFAVYHIDVKTGSMSHRDSKRLVGIFEPTITNPDMITFAMKKDVFRIVIMGNIKKVGELQNV